MINRQDRRDFLMDTGVSPGEDDSYDKQKAKLIKEHGEWIDNTKVPFLQRIEQMIQTARVKEKSEGGPDIPEFLGQVGSKLVPAPSELNPVNIIKGIPSMVKGVANIAQHPIAAAKQFALDPPAPSTIAAMVVPGAALKTYREFVPLAARTYLHHMAGIPTPFTKVTEVERKVLSGLAQERIDKLLDMQKDLDVLNAKKAAATLNTKLDPIQKVIKKAVFDGILDEDDYPVDYLRTLNAKEVLAIRKRLTRSYIRHFNSKSDYYSELNMQRSTLKNIDELGDEADNANVRKDYEEITGKKLPGFQAYLLDQGEEGRRRLNISAALGKTYVEPMVDPKTGKVVPKAIHDTYKFYPGVYNYGDDYMSGSGPWGLRNAAHVIKYGLMEKKPIRDILKELFGVESNAPFGRIARQAAFGKKASIINIPLTKPGPMNAYDKAAILLGGHQLAKERKK